MYRLGLGNPFHSEDVTFPFDISTCPASNAVDWTHVFLEELDDPLTRANLLYSDYLPILPRENFRSLLNLALGNYR